MADRSDLLAYLIDCGEDHGGQIYFASTRGKAKALAANAEDTDITGVVSCLRKPEYDQYAPGPVPIQVMLADGWWYECSGCSQKIYEESTAYHFDEPCDGPVVIEDRFIWCCQACKDAEDLRDRQRKEQEAIMALAARNALLAKFPDAMVLHVDGYGTMQTRVSFRVPVETQDSIEWELGDSNVWVTKRDMEAWYRYEDSRLEPQQCWESEGGRSA